MDRRKSLNTIAPNQCSLTSEQLENKDDKTSSTLEPIKVFLQEVSILGVKYVVLSQSHFRRFIWFCCVCFALGFCFYQVWERCHYFWTRPLVTSVRILRPDDGIRFPTVTLCSENRVMRSKAEEIGGPALVQDFHRVFKIFDNLENPPPYINISELKQDWGQLYLNVSPTAMETFAYFKWNGQASYEPEKSFSEVNTDIGHCFQFNSADKNYTTKVAGTVHGLVLVLQLHHNDYLVPTTDSVSEGFRIALHTPTTVPQMKKNAFKVGPGYQNFVSVKVVKTIDPGPPDVNCSMDASYSYTQCLRGCETDFFIQRCGCKDFYMSGVYPVCSLNQSAHCGVQAYTSFTSENREQMCGCQRQCVNTDYAWSISAAALSKTILMNAFNENIDWDEFHKDHVIVNIYLEDISYTAHRTVLAYSSLAVLCDIGGALGLFLGSTFLTVMEILDFICVRIVRWCFYEHKK